MFIGSNNHGPIKSIAGGISSRSSSTDDSTNSGSSCSRGDINHPDDVGEKEKSQTDFCTNAPSSNQLSTKTETDAGGAFVAAGDEQTKLVMDLTDLNLRPCPSCPQPQVFSYSGAAAAARKQRPLTMHHSANIYEEEGEFDVLSEYTSSSSSAEGTPNSNSFFFGGDDDDFEEKEDSCIIKHIPRLGEWRVMQDSTFMQQEAGDGAGNGAGSPRQRRGTSGVGLNIVPEEDEAESVNIARHAAIGTLGRKCQQAVQNAVPAGSTLRGENRRANARARARAYARARANARGCVRTQVSSTGLIDPPPVCESQGFTSLGDISSSDVDALKPSSDFVYLTPRDQQQLRRLQQRQQVIGEGETLGIKKPRCLDVKAQKSFEDNESDDGLYYSKNGILGARVVDVCVPEEGGGVDEPGESRSLTPDTGATSISSTSSSGKSCKVESNGGGERGGGGDGMSGVEQHSVFDRRVRSGRFYRSTSSVLQGNRASTGVRGEERSFERSDSFTIFTRNTSHSSVCKGRSQSLKEDSAEGERRRGHRQSSGVLRSLSRGISKVWGKVTADHPEPLPVSRTMTKEERKALRRRRELELLEDWQANSTAELHQVRVVCKEEETVWR